MDSGSFQHVCPPSFAPAYPVQPVRCDERRLRAVGANGRSLRFYGMKKVTLALTPLVIIVVNLAMLNVNQTVLSVDEFQKQGCDVIFGQNRRLYLQHGDIPRITIGNMTYLEAEVLSANIMDDFHAERQMKDENDEFTYHSLLFAAVDTTSVNTNVVQLLRLLSLGCDKMQEHDVVYDTSAALHSRYYVDKTMKEKTEQARQAYARQLARPPGLVDRQ
eukprot:10245241-Heterocapsa_arctica.AAC.1